MCSIGKSSLKSIDGQPFHSCHSYVQWQGTKSRLNHRRSIQAIFHLDEEGMTASSNGADSKSSENHGKMQVSWNMFTGFMEHVHRFHGTCSQVSWQNPMKIQGKIQGKLSGQFTPVTWIQHLGSKISTITGQRSTKRLRCNPKISG